MKRFLLLVLFGAAVALAIWLGMRSASPKISSTTVTSLLPKETLGFVHVPDLNSARAKWHESDIYQLWREPALQDFLRKPLAKNPNSGAVSQTLQQLEPLGMRDMFLAVVGWGEDQPKFVGGFHFKGSADDAERVIGQWRGRAETAAPNARREKVTYEQHQIQVVSEGSLKLATVYDRDWFFAGNDLPALQALLDRADGRAKDGASTLSADETFAAAFKHMPRSYAAFGYGRLDQYFEKLAANAPAGENTNTQLGILRQIQSLAAATDFEGGKVRDVLFVGMPKAAEESDLTRASLSMATAESFLYCASFFNFANATPSADPQSAALPAVLQRFFSAFSATGISAADWKSAFGAELGLIGNWPANDRLPGLLATLPVRDGAKADEVVRALTAGSGDAKAPWTSSEKAGVRYYLQTPSNPMVPIAAAIALSDNLLVAGLDRASVETAITRGSSLSGGLAGSQQFTNAERLVPAAKSAFLYIDTALLYARLDAAIRPMLVMAAAFLPSIAETVDLNRLPPPEIVTKHLSPLVLSQAYETDGYVTESRGPVSLYAAGIGIATAAGAGASFYQRQMSGGSVPTSAPTATLARPLASPSATPAGEP